MFRQHLTCGVLIHSLSRQLGSHLPSKREPARSALTRQMPGWMSSQARPCEEYCGTPAPSWTSMHASRYRERCVYLCRYRCCCSTRVNGRIQTRSRALSISGIGVPSLLDKVCRSSEEDWSHEAGWSRVRSVSNRCATRLGESITGQASV